MNVRFREARFEDVGQIVEMLADDKLGSHRERFENPLPRSYYEAFAAIENDPNNELVVACIESDIVGVQQLTFTPYLTYQGGWRATIEGVRTASSVRGQGIGRQLIRHGIGRAKERGCHLIQLTTDKQRPEALQFMNSWDFQLLTKA